MSSDTDLSFQKGCDPKLGASPSRLRARARFLECTFLLGSEFFGPCPDSTVSNKTLRLHSTLAQQKGGVVEFVLDLFHRLDIGGRNDRVELLGAG